MSAQELTKVKTSRRGRPPKLKRIAKSPIRNAGILCKAGNLNCSLAIGRSLAMGAVGVLPCDICCTELAFCRDCKCILCSRTMNCDYTSYMSIRCLSRLSGVGFCGHAAHLTCALECKMAGVVKQLGLDMEYICRRCDRKTDLREHVIQLVESLKYTNSHATIEKNLNMALQIIQGTQHGGAKSLESLIKNAVQMVWSGSNTQDIYDMLNNGGAESLTVEKMKENPGVTTMSVEDEMHVVVPEKQHSLQPLDSNDRATQKEGCTTNVNTGHEGIELAPLVTGSLNPIPSTSNLPPVFLSSVMAPDAGCKVVEDANDVSLSSPTVEGLQLDAGEVHIPQKTMIGVLEEVNASFSTESSMQVLNADFERDIQQALAKLQEAQAAEYNLTHERLNNQKECVKKWYEELEAARCGLDQDLSKPTLEATGASMYRVSGIFQSLKSELATFHTMLGKQKGFDQA